MSSESPTSVLGPPEGWREQPLSVVAEPRFSSVDKLTRASEEPVRLCNYTDVYNHDYITGDLDFMRASATQREIDRFGLRVGDVIITKDSETPDDIGVPTVVDYAAPDLVCGYHLALIRPDQQQVDPTFLAKQLRHFRLARYFGQQSNGLTRYGLPIGAVTNAPLWLPELDEQKAVGTVLRLMDEAIAKTEAVIAKLRQVRAGLLHDLLTRGLDSNGQLRDAIAHPEQFKESRLGRIPKEWELRPIGDFVLSSAFGPRFPGSLYDENGDVATMRTTDMDDEGNLDLDVMPLARLNASEFSEHMLAPNDVLVSRSGTCGITAVFHGYLKPVLPGAFLIRFRLGKGLLPEFLRVALNWTQHRQRLLVRAEGGVQKNLRTDSITGLCVPFPDEAEQARILDSLAVQQSLLGTEDRELAKLKLLKSGLMTDLLTGRVRVPEPVGTTP